MVPGFSSVFSIGHLKLANQSEAPTPDRFVLYAILAPKLHRDHDDMGGIGSSSIRNPCRDGRIVADRTNVEKTTLSSIASDDGHVVRRKVLSNRR